MSKRLHVLAVLAWVLVVFYPNPTMLFATLWHTLSPPIDGDAAKELAATLPNDPNVIRDRVLNDIIPYEYDWPIYDVPWYFPSVREAIRDGRGDCESQALVFASILHTKQIPYQLKMSFDHIWVDYEQKEQTHIEHDDRAFVQMVGDSVEVKLPKHFDLGEYVNIQLDARWHPMPIARKILLFVGLLIIVVTPRLQRIAKRRCAMRDMPVGT